MGEIEFTCWVNTNELFCCRSYYIWAQIDPGVGPSIDVPITPEPEDELDTPFPFGEEIDVPFTSTGIGFGLDVELELDMFDQALTPEPAPEVLGAKIEDAAGTEYARDGDQPNGLTSDVPYEVLYSNYDSITSARL